MLCTDYSVPGKHCENILVEVLISLRCMHAKIQADYWILIAPQGLVRSVPWGGVALDRKTVACEYHEGFNAVPVAFHTSTLLCRARCWNAAGPEEDVQVLGQSSAIGWATQCQPALPCLSVTVASLCLVLCLHSLWLCAVGLAGCQFVTACLLFTPSHPTAHI